MSKDRLSKTSGCQFHKWLFGPERISGLLDSEIYERICYPEENFTSVKRNYVMKFNADAEKVMKFNLDVEKE